VKKVVISIHAVVLILVSFYLLVLLLASGHKLNFNDFSQLKLLSEILIFFFAGVALYFDKKWLFVGKTTHIVLLILVQLSFIDLMFAVSDVEYGDEKPVLIFMVFGLVFISNLFLIYKYFKQPRKNIRHANQI